MPDLVDIEDVKDWLGLTDADTSEDTKLERLVTAVSADFLSRIRRPGFSPAANYTETQEIANWQHMTDVFLRNYPVNSVASVTINEQDLPEFDPDQPEIPGWVFDNTRDPESRQAITLRGCGSSEAFSPRRSIYRPSPMRVAVAYNGGYAADSIPANVQQALIEWIAWKRGVSQLNAENQTAQSLYIGTYRQDTMVSNATLKASQMDMPETVSNVIELYKRPIVG
jgi:hypothetical protein